LKSACPKSELAGAKKGAQCKTTDFNDHTDHAAARRASAAGAVERYFRAHQGKSD
jgi:hypothetical protein